MTIEFEEEKYNRIDKVKDEEENKMVSWLIKRGLAKDKTSAQIILIVIIILAFSITVYNIFF